MEQLRFLPLSLGRIMLPVCSLTLFLSLWGRYIQCLAWERAVTRTSLPWQVQGTDHNLILSIFTSSVCGTMIRIIFLMQDRVRWPASVACFSLGTGWWMALSFWYVRNHTTVHSLPRWLQCGRRFIQLVRRLSHLSARHYGKDQEDGFFLNL